MEEQTKTRGSSQNNTGSDIENVWSEENEIYYYSNFELFENTSVTQLFYQYSIFIEEVSKQLGQQWKMQAQLLVQTHISSRQIFMIVLAIWLKHHGPKFVSNTPAPTFDQSVVDEFQIQIRQDLGSKMPQNYKINKTSARAICMGFFLTANEIWEQMFQNSKKEDTAKTYLLGSVSKTIQRSFRPIMVVRQKISSLFGRKKIHRNETIPSTIDSSNSENIFENCFLQFRRNIDLQKQVERKMSQVNLEDDGFEKNEIISQKKYMSTQSFREQQAPVKQTLISSVYKYVTEFLNKNYSWNVASSFVTQILQLSQIDAEEGTTIKILRPAQDFYNQLVLVWLSFQKSDIKLDFGQYLTKVKSSFGISWQQKYIIPTKYFFDRLNENWGQIQAEVSQKKLNDREIMSLLLSRIRARMEIDWNKKIRIKQKRVKTQEKTRQ